MTTEKVALGIGRVNEVQKLQPKADKPARTRRKKRRRTAPKEDASPVETRDWRTREESSAWLGVSVQTLRNHERRGRLHPQYVYREDVHGIERRMTVYDPAELNKLPRSSSKREAMTLPHEREVAYRCFEMINAGVSLQQIVVDLRETPDTICALYDKWLDMGGGNLVITPEGKAALEKIAGPFTTVVELLEKLEKLKVHGAPDVGTADPV